MSAHETKSLNQAPNVAGEFAKIDSTYFLASAVEDFDLQTQQGKIRWNRFAKKPRFAFNQGDVRFEPTQPWIFPNEYEAAPALPFEISFVTPSTVRIRIQTKPGVRARSVSPMLAMEPPSDKGWRAVRYEQETEWTHDYGSVTLAYDPFRLIFKDKHGKVLTQTQHYTDTTCLVNTEPMPFSFVRSTSDMKQTLAASFTLSPQEKLFGCGESFTRLDKRGQKIDMWVKDAHGVQTSQMYKPVPFFLSNRGYGMFVHSSAPMTFDLGCSYDQANMLYSGDETLDLFFFFGTPKHILSEYTSLTGRSPVPPLWSFGLWMSRITYKSEDEVREVARKHRELRIPCDVIHLDTGWFEKDWRCDYRFSENRFQDPLTMIADLKKEGFRISLWQLPYFTPTNPFYEEIVSRGFGVKDADGQLPTEDAILDFTNPEAVSWYQEKLAKLLQMGVGAIKVDFGEAGPKTGLYASGKSGFYEHNLYPLRYNRAAADITKWTTGDSIIWARSAWAGSQRYPLHWGGDAETTNNAMAATLRGGLSLGLCGFTYWSHDIGGFTRKSPEELYRRWVPFGMLASHSRCHGVPPKEPWEYGETFVRDFRAATELRYKLMPYIYSQAHISSREGYPIMRTLFFEFPDDSTSWFIEDEYMFGSDLLVAPLMEQSNRRNVYLPPGTWIDYQTGKVYAGSCWHDVEAGDIPVVIMVRNGTLIPHIPLAQSTDHLDWNAIQFVKYGVETTSWHGYYYNPVEKQMYELEQMEHETDAKMIPVDILKS